MRLAWLVLLLGACTIGETGAVDGDDGKADGPDGEEAIQCPSAGAGFQAQLDAAVALNHGKGPGLLRIECADGSLIWEGASGGATTDDAFEIQSTTKALTAALVLTFVEDGHITLDTPIGTVLDAADTQRMLVVSGHDYGPELTVKQLLNHTAGLPDYWNDGPFDGDEENVFQRDYNASDSRTFQPRELLAYARQLTPIGRPGGAHHYSDTGYVLLGLLVEKLGGAPYQDVLRTRILAPLGMSDTYLRYREQPAAAKRVVDWYDEGELVAGKLHQTADWAGGGLVSTAADLAKFMRGLASGRVIHDSALRAAMTTWVPAGEDGIEYGLGLYHVTYDDEPARGDWWGHDGYGNAFMYAMEPNLIVTGTLDNAQADWGAMVCEIQTALLAR